MQISNKYKRFLGIAILSIASSILFYGCPTIPEFPVQPSVKYDDVSFEIFTYTTETGVQITSEKINLTLYFEDGDGDLGLNLDETNPPFNEFNIPLQPDNSLIRIGDSDTLPAYNPINYYIPATSDSLVYSYIRYEGTDSAQYINERLDANDTIYVIPNPRSKNIFIDFYYQPTNNSDFVLFDFNAAPYYQNFNGRFPRLNTEEYERPINGTLTYSLESVIFQILFRQQPIILEFYITDRAGNKSNVARTEPFILSEVQIESTE